LYDLLSFGTGGDGRASRWAFEDPWRMTHAHERLRVRFGVRAVLIVVLCLAGGCALLFSTPAPVAVPLLVLSSVALPALLAAGTIYTRGNSRAFCIGGLFPSGLLLYITGWVFGLFVLYDEPGELRNLSEWAEFFETIGTQYRTYAASTWVMTLLIGTIVVLVRVFSLKEAEDA
jgi:hypothetical protein